MTNKVNTDSNKRIITFFIILIQSIGIRFFDGQGTLLSIVVFLLSLEGVRQVKRSDARILLVIIVFLLINKAFNEDFAFSAWTFQISLVLSTYFFLLQYRNPKYRGHMFSEFYCSLKWFTYHALASYALYLIVPNLFIQVYTNRTLFGLFYVSKSDFGRLARNTGLGWEPGTTQLIANLFLFFSIKLKRKIYYLGLIALCVLTTFSTTGLSLLGINVVYYFIINVRKMNPITLLISFLLAVAVIIPLIISNSSEKLNGTNTSGIVRQRDFLIGFSLIEEKPIIGHGLFDVKYLLTKKYAVQIEDQLFTDEYLEDSGSLGGGYTNGLLGIFCWYGIPAGILILSLFYRNRFVGSSTLEKVLFLVIFGFSSLSEPITYTSLFLMFPLSYLIFKNNKKGNRATKKITAYDYQNVKIA